MEDFLHSVWQAQGELTGYVFVSFKDGEGNWTDIPIPWPHKRLSKYLPQEVLEAEGDVYFCPNVFTKPRRMKQYAQPSVWLYADLDEVRPDSLPLKATSAWATSSGRFQCLWRASAAIRPEVHAVVNRRLTYLVGADKGGWSVTKVLRVPGTYNYKRKVREPVEFLWHDLQHYRPRVIADLVRGVETGPVGTTGLGKVKLPDMTADAVAHKYRDKLPKRARVLIRAKSAQVGERSERLWELDCLLMDVGISVEEAVVLVRGTVWNKYAGQRREIAMLYSEMVKAKEHVEAGRMSDVGTLEDKVQLYADFLSTPLPTEVWTVEGIWSHDAHGLIAGEPKTFKSFVATDLAVSVASGTKFLGQFEVPETGPVIIIQEENTPAMMKDRLEKIAYSRGIGAGARVNGNREIEISGANDLPIILMNNAKFNLTDEDHIAFLKKLIETHKPRLVVLDPIYLMMPGVDENSAVGMTPVLRELLGIKQQYNVGILIVHHYNKPRSEDDRHPGLRISGTSVFYRWFESALYLSKGQAPGEVVMQPEHRGSAPVGHIKLEFDLGEMGEPDYHVDVEITKDANAASLRRQMKSIMMDNNGYPLKELAENLNISVNRCKRMAERLGYRVEAKEGGDGKPGRPGLRVWKTIGVH